MKRVFIWVGLALGLGLLAYEIYILDWLFEFIGGMVCTF